LGVFRSKQEKSRAVVSDRSGDPDP